MASQLVIPPEKPNRPTARIDSHAMFVEFLCHAVTMLRQVEAVFMSGAVRRIEKAGSMGGYTGDWVRECDRVRGWCKTSVMRTSKPSHDNTHAPCEWTLAGRWNVPWGSTTGNANHHNDKRDDI